eukprot:6276479-Ditylum_brightwellii.AAC.1
MGSPGALHPCQEAHINLETSKDSTPHLVDAILGQVNFDPLVHAATMETGKASGNRRKDEVYIQVLSTLQTYYTADNFHSVECAGKCTHHWINVVPFTSNNSVLGCNECFNM